MRTHPLDCPIWSALTSTQAPFGSDGRLARRFREDVSPFAATADASGAAIEALGALAHADDDMSMLERKPPAPPPGVTLKMSASGVQMVLEALTAGGSDLAFEQLDDADSADMVALATLTRPGPFRASTHKLGRFIGIRDNGQLVAMAGERLQFGEFAEVSGICTHPDYRGRGYAAALTRVVSQRLLSEGRKPFLHAYASNTGAIAVYERLGFKHRCDVTHAMWSRP